MKKQKFRSIKHLLESTPIYSFTKRGEQMEPISLIVAGSKKSILDIFKTSGWQTPDKVSIVSYLKMLKATIFSSSYPKGPFNQSFYLNKPFQLAFEQPTKSDTFRRRHHLRLWETNFALDNKDVWVGTVSYDRSIGISDKALPTHHINPNLNIEDTFLAQSLSIKKPVYVKLYEPEKGAINTGDSYTWDGMALFIELPVSK